MITGCKLLQADGSSLTDEFGRVSYPVGEWLEVPGHGAYVAVTGGLTSANVGVSGAVLAYLECEEPTGAEAPGGVLCFRRVRRLAAMAPERISPELRGLVARDAPNLTREDRMALVAGSTPDWRGWVACDAPDLTREDRLALARESTPEWRGRVACDAPDLTREDRLALAAESTPEWRGLVARFAPGLTRKDRMALARESAEERGEDGVEGTSS